MTRKADFEARSQHILQLLAKAGGAGRTIAELAEALGQPKHAVRYCAEALAERGDAYTLEAHPALLYYPASLPRSAAEEQLEARARQIYALRADRRNESAGWQAGSQRGKRSSHWGSRLPAVDPNCLRSDAEVTKPDHVQIQFCPSGQDMRRRADPNHRGPLCDLPFGQYEEPPSSWVQALTTTPRA